MTRNKFGFLVLIGASIALGAFVATLSPPASRAASAELDLAPPPTSVGVTAPSFADLADKTIPSVVTITSRKLVDVRDPHDFLFDNPFFRRYFRGQPFGDEQSQPRAPRKRSEMQSGSGFFITADGYILTNKHVVEDAKALYVWTSEMNIRDEGLEAKLVGADPFVDVALLKVEGKRFIPLSLGDSDRLRVGEWVVAIGNPLVFRNSVTAGVVSGKGRRLDDFSASNLEDYIQTDAAINFGNSGGPLLNARGEVVGINSAIIRDDPGETAGLGGGYIQGIGFALPINPVKRVLSQLAGTGTVKRGRLGVSVQPLDADKADYLKTPAAKGAYVATVEKDSPAEKAGLKVDDVILAVDGKKIASSEDLVTEVSSRRPGERVTLTVWRDRKEVQTPVTLAERTNGGTEIEEQKGESRGEDQGSSNLGFTVAPPSAALRDQLQELNPPVKGVMVRDVDPESSVARKGLAAGMIVLSLNGQPTPNMEAFRRTADSVKPGDVVRLRIFSPGNGEESLFFRAPSRK